MKRKCFEKIHQGILGVGVSIKSDLYELYNVYIVPNIQNSHKQILLIHTY